MFRRFQSFVLGIGLLVAQSASAGITTGALIGQVQTVSGDPVACASALLESPSLMGNATVACDPGGTFRAPRLPPGVYSVVVMSDGLPPARMTGVVIRLGETTVETIQLASPTYSEEITIHASTKDLNVASTSTGGNFTATDYEQLPVSRAYQNIAALLPGVYMDTAIADPLRLQDTPSFLGSAAPENSYLVDGMQTTDSTLGLNGAALPFNFVDEIQVLSAGYEAEYGRSTGGVINVITKAGGNSVRGTAFGYMNTYRMNGNGWWKASRGTSTPWIGSEYGDLGVDVGGPIAQNHAWFYAAFSRSQQNTKSTGYFGQDLEARSEKRHYAAKLSWAATDSQNMTITAFGDPTLKDSITPTSSGNGAPSSYEYQERLGSFNVALKHTAFAGDSFLFDSAISYRKQRTEFVPKYGSESTPLQVFYWADPAAHGDANPLHTNGYTDGGPPFALSYPPDRAAVDLKITWLVRDHNIRSGIQYDRQTSRSFERYPGEHHQEFYDDHYMEMTYDADGDSRTDNLSLFVQDSWQPTSNVFVNAGLRFDRQSVYGITGARAVEFGSLGDFSNGWSPRLGLSYDPSKRGAAKLYASYCRFYESMPIYANANVFGHVILNVSYHHYGPDGIPFTSDDGPETVLYDQDTLRDPPHVQSGLKAHYVDEEILGYEWSPANGLTIGARGIYRSLHRAVEDMRGGGGLSYTFGNPGVGEASAFPLPSRTFAGIELTFDGRPSESTVFHASYLRSRTRGNYEGFYVTNYPQAAPNISVQFDFAEWVQNAYGLLYDDRPHRFKVYGARQFSTGTTIGGLLTAQSGRPINGLGWDRYYGVGNSLVFVDRRGTDGRTPATWQWDLHLEQSFPIRGLSAALILDVFNVTNQNEVADVDDNKYTLEFDNLAAPYTVQNPYWKTPSRYQTPRLVRLGMKVNF